MAEEHLHSRSLCYSWCNMYSQQARLCSCAVSACICSAHPSCDPAVFLTSFYAQWILLPHVHSGDLSALCLLWGVTEFIKWAWAGRWCWYCIFSPKELVICFSLTTFFTERLIWMVEIHNDVILLLPDICYQMWNHWK